MDENKYLSKKFFKNVLIIVCKGDITKQNTDAIVNAANSHLAHGGGVAGAIVRAGGDIIQEESNEIIRDKGIVSVGNAVYTSAGSLKSKYVIHTVGPRWGEGDEDNKLKNAILSVLNIAKKLSVSSVSIPAISTGIFGFPKERGVKIIFQTVVNWIWNNPNSSLKEIRFCNIDDLTSNLFIKELENL